MKVYFIVLHYLNMKDTEQCVNSILEIKYERTEIVIVDNGSNNGTGEKLRDKFKNNLKVKVIISKDNLGFSNGNNIGIYSIKDKKHSLIVICNSDLIFNDICFSDVIVKEYIKYKYAVLGPDITSEDKKKHENPTGLELVQDKDLQREINIFKILKKMNDVNLISLSMFVHKLFSKKRKSFSYLRPLDNQNEPIKVHGACFVLSPKYFEKFDGLYSGTFLFEEENILGNMCLNSNLKILYTPHTSVIHLGSKSYKAKHPDVKKRFSNYIENCLDSLLAYNKSRREHEI